MMSAVSSSTPCTVSLHTTQLVVRSRRLPSPDDFHRLLFLGWTNKKERPFLFRADRVLSPGGNFMVVSMLVTAPCAPDWSTLEAREPNVFLERRERTVTWNLRAGDTFAFKVRGHTATERILPELVEAADREGRRVPRGAPTYTAVARTYADRVAWLRARFVGSGCALRRTPRGEEMEPTVSNTVDLVAEKDQSARRRERVVAHVADFDGQLVVTSPARFAQVLQRGLSGCDRRHLGCGLVSIRRIA